MRLPATHHKTPARSGLARALIAVLLWFAPGHAPASEHLGLEPDPRMLAPVSLSWSGTELKDGLQRLLTRGQLALVLDRRVDPGQAVELVAESMPVIDVVDKATEPLRLKASIGEGLIYVGPPDAARRLATLIALRRDEAAALRRADARRFLEVAAWSWDDLAEPRELIRELADETGWSLAGLEAVPHDLWPAAEWPPLPWVDRLSLVAVQFDLTFELDASQRAIRLVPAPADPRITREYPGGASPAARARELAEMAAGADVDVRDGGTIAVVGRYEDHLRIAASANPSRRRPAGPTDESRQVHDLRIDDAPLSAVLQAIGRQLSLTVRLDSDAIAAAGIAEDQPISVRIEGATLDELLAAIAESAGVSIRREGDVVYVVPPASR